MSDDKNQPIEKKPEGAQPPADAVELDEKALGKVSGGLQQRTGDEDLEDLEIQRLRRR